jgi:cation/acetate symporter
MLYHPSYLAVFIFSLLVAVTLGISFWMGGKAKSAKGYFAAGGHIPWFVNGVAFAGDYLSAASFLGICGMIAFFGFDGFLYSIGFLGGWILALLVIAEPLKRMGKFTFADAIDARFNSKALRLAAAISTLLVSLFYLIPQMVGAGTLVQPLLGLPHWAGVVMVGTVVIVIVTTAGMVSTTWVQFIKGGLLVVFTGVLVVMILGRGMEEKKVAHAVPIVETAELTAKDVGLPNDAVQIPADGAWKDKPYVRFKSADGAVHAWQAFRLHSDVFPCQLLTTTADGKKLVNGLPQSDTNDIHAVGTVEHLAWVDQRIGKHLPPQEYTNEHKSGPLSPSAFLSTLRDSQIATWSKEEITEANGDKTTVYYPVIKSGADLLQPGNYKLFAGLKGTAWTGKINFLSLMLALLCGTASLPHILIRYYTVKDTASARKSTIVGIGAIGAFYVLTLFLGLGAMVSGALDPTDNNMAAPLLAKSFSPLLFAIISAIAFTTVLGTVSGLIVAASGTVAHDLASTLFKLQLNDHQKVRLARQASLAVGAIAIVLGILFASMNVASLVGWAFSIAASANLPALLMCLFWKRATRQGMVASIVVGALSSLAWVLLSDDTFKDVFHATPLNLVPFSQPGIVTIPLSLAVGVAVSLLTKKEKEVERTA